MWQTLCQHSHWQARPGLNETDILRTLESVLLSIARCRECELLLAPKQCPSGSTLRVLFRTFYGVSGQLLMSDTNDTEPNICTQS